MNKTIFSVFLGLTGFVMGANASSPSTLDQGLVAYYQFNGNAVDSSGSGNNGTPVNALYTSDRNGVANSALRLTGSNGYVKYPDSVFGPSTSGFTWSLWILPDPGVDTNNAAGGSSVMSHGSTNGEAGISWSGSNYKFGVNLARSSWQFVYGTQGDTLTHLVCVYQQGARLEVWINGQLSASRVPPNENLLVNAYGNKSAIGADVDPLGVLYCFKGVMDDIRIYNRALSSTEVQQLFASDASIPSVTPPAVSSITASGATLNGLVNPNGADTQVNIEYGTTTGYGSSTLPQGIGSGTSAVLMSSTLTGLSPNTIYHLRLDATNSKGMSSSSDLAFTTLTDPIISVSTATNITTSGATLGDSVNPRCVDTTVYYQYGITTGYGSTTVSQDIGSGLNPVLVGGTLTGLLSGTTYHYRLVTTSSAGTFYSPDQTFSVEPPSPTPIESGTNVVLQRGDAAPGIAGAIFSTSGVPAMNDSLYVAFQAAVTGSNTALTKAIGSNNSGIWAADANGLLQLVVRTGTVAPGTNGGVFSALSAPVYNNNNAVAFKGTLKTGVGDATTHSTPKNNIGIWSNTGGTLHLVARQGAWAPGWASGLLFSSFDQFALPDQGGATNTGGVVLLASVSGQGISSKNNQGIWAEDATGNPARREHVKRQNHHGADLFGGD